MRTAQEQAVVELACERGLLDAAQRARLEAPSPSPLAQRLVVERLMAPQALAGLLKELAPIPWRCAASCAAPALGWQALAQLPRLACPRCGKGLVRAARSPSESAAGSGTRGPRSTGPIPEPESDETRAADSRPARAPTAASAPRRLGPYTIASQLGRGSCATVYLARREGVEREFALKVLDEPDPEDEELLLRFVQEARVASRIRHPGVIPVFDAGQEGRCFYYAMDYCPGQTLKQRIREGDPIAPYEAADIVARLAGAVEAAHQAGVIHRDLKPANIILEEGTGTPRITDFGMARDERQLRAMTATGDVLGTPYYMAPEQFRGDRELDHRIDVYALGVILYELFTGTRPYDAPSPLALKRRVELGDPRRPTELVPHLPPELEAVCLKAMALEARDRHATAGDLAEELAELVDRERRRASRSKVVPSTRRGLVVAAVTGILLGGSVVGSVVALALRKGEKPPTPPPTAPPPVRTEDPEVVARQLELARELAVKIGRSQGAEAGWEPVEAALAEAERAAGKDADLRTDVDLARAGHLLRRGKPLEAMRLAEGRGERDVGLVLCARAYEKLGQPREAARVWSDLARRSPSSAAGATARAAVARLEGDGRRALELATAATEAAPEAPTAWMELARARLALLQLEPALRAIDRMALLAPDDPEEALLRARLLVHERKASSAAAQLERAASLTGGVADGDGLALRARVELVRGDKSAARRTLEQLLQRDPAHLEALVHLAALEVMERNRSQAGLAWEKAGAVSGPGRQAVVQEHWPDRAGLLAALETHTWGGQTALAWVDEVVTRVPEAARESLGVALEAAVTGEPWSSIAPPLSAALAAVPEDAQLRREAIRLAIGRCQGREALRHLEAWPGAGPRDPERLRLQAEATWLAGRPGAARLLFREAAGATPAGVEQRCAAAQALWLERSEREAVAEASLALDQDASHHGSLLVKGLALAALERDAEVEALVKTGLEQRGFLDIRLLAVARSRSLSTVSGIFGAQPERVRDPALERLHERSSPPHIYLLCRDLIVRRRDGQGSQLRVPYPEWEQDAYYHLTLGRWHVGTRVRAAQRAWRRALELDPALELTEADARDVRTAFGVELERFMGE